MAVKAALRYFCRFYLVLVTVAVIVDVLIDLTMPYGGLLGPGCHFTDAMVVGIRCQGFSGADAAALFLNWPLLMAYAPMLSAESLWMLIPSALVWLPPLYVLVGFLRRKSSRGWAAAD